MLLEEFFDYKNKFVEDIITDETIVDLIDPNHMYSNPVDMIYDNVNPYEFYPETIEKGKVYVCCDVDVTAVGGKPFYELALYVWVFAHRSILRLPEGGVRTDKLCSEINKKLNGSVFYGLGELDLDRVKRFSPIADYTGKVMTFVTTDFNRIHNPKKALPANRKDGV